MIGSEYTINGKTYRNLEAQVARNQELSIEAAQKAEQAQNGLAATNSTLTEYVEGTAAALEALDERVWDLETGGSKQRISEPVKSMPGTVIPSAIWSGELDTNTGDYDIYCTIPISYANQGDYLSDLNLATILFGGPVPVKLPDAIGTSSAKEIFYTVHKPNTFTSAINGFDLNSSPLLTAANTWYYRQENGFTPWQTYNFNICIHVHGRKVA